ILDFSKIEAGKLEFENLEFDLDEVVEGALSVLVPQARTKGLELRSEIDSKVCTFLCGDPGRLRQVLTNLLNNAVKFTEQGEVVLQCWYEAIAEESPDALALTDMQMPGMNGMELAQAIKSDPITKDMRVIMISSVGNSIDAQTRKNADIDAFFEKPVKQSQLHQCLASVLGSAPLKRTKANNHTLSEARPRA